MAIPESVDDSTADLIVQPLKKPRMNRIFYIKKPSLAKSKKCVTSRVQIRVFDYLESKLVMMIFMIEGFVF